MQCSLTNPGLAFSIVARRMAIRLDSYCLRSISTMIAVLILSFLTLRSGNCTWPPFGHSSYASVHTSIRYLLVFSLRSLTDSGDLLLNQHLCSCPFHSRGDPLFCLISAEIEG